MEALNEIDIPEKLLVFSRMRTVFFMRVGLICLRAKLVAKS